MHEISGTTGTDETRGRQHFEMLRSIGDREAELARKIFYAPVALRQEIQHLEALRIGEGRPDPGQVEVQLVLKPAMLDFHIQLVGLIVEYPSRCERLGSPLAAALY